MPRKNFWEEYDKENEEEDEVDAPVRPRIIPSPPETEFAPPAPPPQQLAPPPEGKAGFWERYDQENPEPSPLYLSETDRTWGPAAAAKIPKAGSLSGALYNHAGNAAEGIARDFSTQILQGVTAPASWIADDEAAEGVQTWTKKWLGQFLAAPFEVYTKAGRWFVEELKEFEEQETVLGVRNPFTPYSDIQKIDAFHDYLEESNENFYAEWEAGIDDLMDYTPEMRIPFADEDGNNVEQFLKTMEDTQNGMSQATIRLLLEGTAFLGPGGWVKGTLKGGLGTAWVLNRMAKSGMRLKRRVNWNSTMGRVSARTGSGLVSTKRKAEVEATLWGHLSPTKAAEKAQKATKGELAARRNLVAVMGDADYKNMSPASVARMAADTDLARMEGTLSRVQMEDGLRGLQGRAEALHEAEKAAFDAGKGRPPRDLDEITNTLLGDQVELLGKPGDSATKASKRYFKARNNALVSRETSKAIFDVKREFAVLAKERVGDKQFIRSLREASSRFEKGLMDPMLEISPRATLFSNSMKAVAKHARDLGHQMYHDIDLARILGAFRSRGIMQLTELPRISVTFNAPLREARRLVLKWGELHHTGKSGDELSDLVQLDAATLIIERLAPGSSGVKRLDLVQERVKSHPLWKKSYQKGEDGEFLPGISGVLDDLEATMAEYRSQLLEILPRIPQPQKGYAASEKVAASRALRDVPKSVKEMLEDVMSTKRFKDGLRTTKMSPPDLVKASSMGTRERKLFEKTLGIKKPTLAYLVEHVENELSEIVAYKRMIADSADLKMSMPHSKAPIFTRNLESLDKKYWTEYERIDSKFLDDHLPGTGKLYMNKGADNPLRDVLQHPSAQIRIDRFDKALASSKASHYFYSLFHAFTLLESATSSLGIGGAIRAMRATGGGLPLSFARNPELIATGPDIFKSIERMMDPKVREALAAASKGRRVGEEGLSRFLSAGGLYGAPKVDYDAKALAGIWKGIIGPAEEYGGIAGKGVGKVARGARWLQKNMEVQLWEKFQGPVKVSTFNYLTEQLLAVKRGHLGMSESGFALNPFFKKMTHKRIKDMDAIEIEREVAKFVNDEFGGQNWLLHTNRFLHQMAKPAVYNGTRRLIESPDWNASAFRQNWAWTQSSKILGRASGKVLEPSMFQAGGTKILGKAVKGENMGMYNPVRGYLGARHNRGLIFGAGSVMNGLNWLMTGGINGGQNLWDNPTGYKGSVATPFFDKDTGRRIYLRPFKSLHDAYPLVWDHMEASDFGFSPYNGISASKVGQAKWFPRKMNATLRPLFQAGDFERERWAEQMRKEGKLMGVGDETIRVALEMAAGVLPFSFNRKPGAPTFADNPLGRIGSHIIPVPTKLGMSNNHAVLEMAEAYRDDDYERVNQIANELTFHNRTFPNVDALIDQAIRLATENPTPNKVEDKEQEYPFMGSITKKKRRGRR